MTAIVSPHVYCNDGIITDLSGYGCIPGNLGLRELYLALTGGTLKGPLNIEYVGGRGLTTGATAGTSIYHELYLLGKLVAWWGIIVHSPLIETR